jgi:hypothetical protein
MTFNQIALKIFKANLRRYKLFLLCCSYSIMVFFVFSTIYTNRSFMNDFNTGSIASNIIAPSIGVTIFSVFFIVYSYNSFIKYRKREIGLFMMLGMTNFDIIKMMLFETSIMALISLSMGLVAGTIFSPLFYYLIFKLINIKGITFGLNSESYLYTAIFFLVVFVMLIVSSVIASFRYKIVNLIKQIRTKDANFLSNPFCGVLGVLIISISFFDMYHNFNAENSYVFLRSFCECLIGIYLCISNTVYLFSVPLRWSKKLKYKSMLFISNLKYSLGQTKKILVVITILTSITILFATISVILMLQAQRLAIGYNPYDIAYVQLNGINNISDNILNNVVKSRESQPTSMKTLEFIQDNTIIYLSANDLNTVLSYNFNVQKGHYICLFQVITDDGYEYNAQEFTSLGITIGNSQQTFLSQGKIIRVLFNRLNLTEHSNIAILNNNDYLNIKSSAKSENIGIIKLMNFRNWRDTDKINDSLNTALKKYNKANLKVSQDYLGYINNEFQTSSKIGDYNNQMQSASFLLFLCCFVGILFSVSAAIMLHFKLMTEFESEKIKYKKISKIGITNEEVSKTISQELNVLFFIPILFSILIATFYSYCLPAESGKGMVSVFYSLIIGLIYLFAQFLFYSIYKRIYLKRLLVEL